MKTRLFVLISVLSFAACSTQTKEKTEAIAGEFLFYSGAAVLNTGSEIYGVTIDDMLHKLHSFAGREFVGFGELGWDGSIVECRDRGRGSSVCS